MTTESSPAKAVAVITGGMGFLGKVISGALLGEGYTVVLLYHQTSDVHAQEALKSFKSGDVFGYRCDLRDKESIDGIIQKIEQHHGPVVYGVHAAHPKLTRKALAEVDATTLGEQLEVSVLGGHHFFRALLARMKSRARGVLIGITTAAIEGEPFKGNYGGYLTAKFALKGLLFELAGELQSKNIHVFAVAPGFMTGGLNADLPERVLEFMKARKQVADEKEVGALVASLCRSPEQRAFSHVVDVE